MAYRSSTRLAGASGTSAAIPVPAGAAADDIAIVALYLETANAVTPPAGFTQEADLNTGTPGSVGRMVVFWKRLTAADSGTYTFTWTGSVWREAVCALFSGRVTTGDPFGATSSNQTTTGTTNTVTGVTAATGDDLVGAASNFNGGSWTPPSGMTERQDGGGDTTLDTADNLTAGPTGNKTFTCSTSGASKGFIGTLTAAGSGGATGDSDETVTSSVTTDGTRGLVGNNTTTVTSSVSAGATKGLVTGSTETVTASVSASGAVGLAQGASASTTSSITTSGSVGGTSPSGDSTVTETTSISSAGTVGKVGSATSSTTSSVSTGAVVGKVAGSSETVTSSISTSGSVISGLSGDSTRATTTSVTTTGAVGRASGATPSVSIDIAAAGSAGYSQVAALTTASSIVASGSLFSPQYRVVFPTHEEPMRTEIDFLRNHHLTHTLSIAKVNGEWRSIRATAIPESVLDELIDGSTLFVGGYDYVVDQATSDELTAAGFPTIPEDS